MPHDVIRGGHGVMAGGTSGGTIPRTRPALRGDGGIDRYLRRASPRGLGLSHGVPTAAGLP